jgi:hypothetical protein
MHRALRLIMPSTGIVELRALKVCRGHDTNTYSGYFGNRDALVAYAEQLSPHAEGVYITLNAINPALLARRQNRVERVRDDATTADADVTRRHWLPIDTDPLRPRGIASSDTEHRAALERRDRIIAYLRALGWPDPLAADSGNGGHALYHIDLPSADSDLVKRCLHALAARFDDAAVVVDTSIGNPGRIWKLYGTLARKGDHTAERPHRLARITAAPVEQRAVPRALLEALAEEIVPPRQEHHQAAAGIDVAAFIERHQLRVARGPLAYAGGQKWVLAVCPWDASHGDNAAYVIQFGSGAVAAGCHHTGCAGKSWRDLRVLYEESIPIDQQRGRRRQGVLPLDGDDSSGGDAPPGIPESPVVTAFADYCLHLSARWSPPEDDRGAPKVYHLAWSIAGALLTSGLSEAQVAVLLCATGARFKPMVRDAMRWDSAARTTAGRMADGTMHRDTWIGLPRLVEVTSDQDAHAILALARVAFPAGGAAAVHPRFPEMGAGWGIEAPPSVADRESFPVDALVVPVLMDLVTKGSQSRRVPADFVGVGVLGALSMAIGATRRLHLYGDFRVPAAGWFAVVAPPSTGKTPGIDLAIGPLETFEEELEAAFQAGWESFEVELSHWRSADRHVRGDPPQPPRRTRILTSDVTLEALALLLRANPRGINVYRDELVGWIHSFNQYRKAGQGADREGWLSLYDCKAMRVDRKAGQTERDRSLYVARPHCSVLGGIQPAKLPRALGGMDDGLKERLLCCDLDPGPYQASDETPSAALTHDYAALIRALLALEFAEDGKPITPTLSPDARRSWRLIELDHLQEQLAEDFPAELRGFYGKCPGHAGRLALLIHEVRTVRGECNEGAADALTVEAAWTLVDYFKSHARVLYGRLRGGSTDRLDAVIAHITRKGGTATACDLVNRKVGGIVSASQARKMIAILEDRGLARSYEHKGAHGSPSLVVTLAGSATDADEKGVDTW